MKRDFSAKRYIYWWADGIHTGVRAEEDARQCLLVIIGAIPEGRKELVTIGDVLCESNQSWREVLRSLKARGLEAGPLLAVGDGALGSCAALEEIYPETRSRHCWVHKTANVPTSCPRACKPRRRRRCTRIWWCPRAQAAAAFNAFLKTYRAEYPKAADKLVRNCEVPLAFYDLPAEHWVHPRTTNPIESTFATVRHRTTRTKNCVSRAIFLSLAFKLVQEAEKSRRRIRGVEPIAELLAGTVFKDGVPASAHDDTQQRLAA
jgi:transposase-like protein